MPLGAERTAFSEALRRPSYFTGRTSDDARARVGDRSAARSAKSAVGAVIAGGVLALIVPGVRAFGAA